MPLTLIENDLTKLSVDAIVNAANTSLLGGGGVDGAIHKAAGKELLKACRALHGCQTGEAKITKGYRLPARYVIHTVGPIWEGGEKGEEKLLQSAYRNSLKLALENKLKTLAFPLISGGVYGYPKAEALRVGRETILEVLKEQELDVFQVFLERRALKLPKALQEDINCFLRETDASSLKPRTTKSESFQSLFKNSLIKMAWEPRLLAFKTNSKQGRVQAFLKHEEEPSKEQILILGLAFKWTFERVANLLLTAGEAFQPTLRDRLLAFCLQTKRIDVYRANEILFAYGEEPLLF